MYLSKLELHGFKSFADRTVVDFSSGVTAVVGPNGCGKSNIVDAVRWVIGEQRARILRSDKMEDIIFNGTSTRRPLGMSEVLLTIENTRGVLPIEYSEVTIGRRLFRSGESEYLLNGVQCRLKDITDLFMDTGMGAGAYSVIELKMIEDILSDSADDRRHMFEEAAGISKYKTRRGQTLRKLAGTQTDLNRVRDIVDELDKHVRSLERQAKKASRFKRLEDRLSYLVQALALTEYTTLKLEKDSTEGRLTNSTDDETRLTAQLAGLEASHEALRIEHIEKEQAVSEAQTKLVHHLDMLRGAESDIRLNKERIESIDRDIARAASDQKLAQERVNELNSQLTLAQALHIQAEPSAAESKASLASAREKKDQAESDLRAQRETFQAFSNKERSLLTVQSDHRRNIDRLQNRIELLDLDAGRFATELKEIDESLKVIQKEKNNAEKNLTAKRAIEQASIGSLKDAKTALSEKMDELDLAVSGQRDVERRLAGLNAETALLDSMLSSYEDLSESIQHLAVESGWSKHELLTVADVIACDDEDRIAVDTALGDFASFIVVRSEKEAAQAIGSLKSDEKGRATFIVADLLPVVPATNSDNDLVPLASRVRVLESDFSALPALLLHDCFLTDNLNDIIISPPSSGRYFSDSGEWFDASGIRHGGSAATGSKASRGRLGRREQFEALTEDIGKITIELNGYSARISAIRDEIENIQIEALENKLLEARSAAGIAERISSEIEYRVVSLESRCKQLGERGEGSAEKREEAASEILLLQKALTQIDADITHTHASRTDVEATVSSLEAASRAAFSAFNEINIVAVQSQNELERLTRECERISGDLDRIAKDSARRREQGASLEIQRDQTTENSEALEIELTRLRKERNELDKVTTHAKDTLAEIKVAVSDLEARLRDIRRQREEVMSGNSRQNIRLAEIDTRLADLVDTMSEDYEIDITSFAMEIDDVFEAETARVEIREFRSRIRTLGPVNALALESFDEEKERLDFLRDQLADLEAAESTLMETISEINETASKRFNETFGAIQGNFAKLFRELFGEEACADVVLVNPDDPLESPIEVMARPKGKKLSVLAQLSGGEKTLTAIALLFAIYLVKPSPFCILDEVDAPLDDANVNRFMHMIRTFSDTTQFILVTHNKRTMEAADCMYGITMAEQGVSKLVSVKFDNKLELVA